MMKGKVDVKEKMMKKEKMKIQEIDMLELKEELEEVVMRYMKDLDIKKEKIKVNGGEIEMGNKIGEKGEMIIGKVMDEMERRNINKDMVKM